MPDQVQLRVDGKAVTVPAGATVAVAVALAAGFCRRSITGEPRGPVCGMGICFECRVMINGEPHCRSCQILAEANMDVRTNG
ncbi:MAG: (2Fe-2S)-binding protein [Acidobacteriaceae bacterium]|nr:(2Fe-2S)-binding protein [Acidobacteriaceae bacterium]